MYSNEDSYSSPSGPVARAEVRVFPNVSPKSASVNIAQSVECQGARAVFLRFAK